MTTDKQREAFEIYARYEFRNDAHFSAGGYRRHLKTWQAALASPEVQKLVESASAVLYHDERGQGVLYAEAMNLLNNALQPFTQ